MYYIVYKTTCLINNKIYIGQHSSKKLRDSYLGSGKYLQEDIKLFGRDKFKRENLYVFKTWEEADKKEAEIVNLEFVARDDTYNCYTGGFTKHKKSEFNYSTASKLASLEYSIKKRFEDKEFYDEWYAKTFAKEVIERRKKACALDRELNGCWWTDKKHTEESKKKIGQSNSVHQKGKGNSQYGTCWIHNLELKNNKKIKKEELSEWLDKGWVKGRKMKL